MVGIISKLGINIVIVIIISIITNINIIKVIKIIKIIIIGIETVEKITIIRLCTVITIKYININQVIIKILLTFSIYINQFFTKYRTHEDNFSKKHNLICLYYNY